MFRIDAESAENLAGDETWMGEDFFPEAEPLGEGIEVEVMSEF